MLCLMERWEPLELVDLSQADDRDLMLRMCGGDEDAFRRLFAKYAPAAKGLAMRIVRQSHLAEEIVQEAFMSVWRDPQSYEDDRGSVRSWLMGTVHHRAVDLVRREEAHRRRAEASIPGAIEEQADHAEDVVETLGRPQERRLVRAAMAELPDEQREVLTMMYFDGMTQTQIAERTGVPLGTVKSRTVMGMRRMRGALEGVER